MITNSNDERVTRLICLFFILAGCILISGCSSPNSAKQVYNTPEPLTDVVNIDKDEVTAWEYESFSDAFEFGSRSIGAPDGKHEGYRGVLTLSDNLIRDYNLYTDDEVEIFTHCDSFDISGYSTHWYYCNNLYSVFDTDWDTDDLYYDGNNHILFSITEKEH